MVFLNMGFDISCLVLALVSYFCVTATMVCIGNHWDAVYRSTGEVRMTTGYSSTGRARLIRSHSSARFCFELSGNSN